MPRIAICFFGITRSLKFTLGSIEECIYSPTRALGEVRVFAHLYDQTSISNPRSGEFGLLDVNEYHLLRADVVEIETPSSGIVSRYSPAIDAFADPWRDRGHSVRNLCLQLHSLSRLEEITLSWMADIYVVARPDILYHDSIAPALRMALGSEAPTVFYPNWQQHGGTNDRFAIVASRPAFEAYCKRGDSLSSYRQEVGHHFNGERLLKYALLRHRVSHQPICVRATRVRFDGSRVTECFRRSTTIYNRTALRYFVRRPLCALFNAAFCLSEKFFDRCSVGRLRPSRVASSFPRLIRSRGSGTFFTYRHQLLFIDTACLIHATQHFPRRSSRYLVDASDLDNGEVEDARQRFVSDGDWDLSKRLITDVSLVRRMMERCKGTSWEDCGEVAWMMDNIYMHGVQDGCRNYSDVLQRCETLDAILSITCKRGSLLTQRELGARWFDEKGGIGVGIDRTGSPFWLSGGAHRLGIALYLGLQYIPVSIEAIHVNAVREPFKLAFIFNRSHELSAMKARDRRSAKP